MRTRGAWFAAQVYARARVSCVVGSVMSVVGVVAQPVSQSRSALRLVAFVAALAWTLPAAGQSPPPGAWTLEDVITRALEQHPSVDAAQARVDSARGARQTAGTLPNPTGTYWLEHGLGTITAAGSPSGGLIRETQTYFTMPLEPLFQRAPRVQRADEELKAAEADVQETRRQIAMDAARLFFRVATAQASLDAARQNRAGLEQLVSYNQARVSQGTIAEVELIRAQVELDRSTSNIALSEVDLLRSRVELWAFMGLPAEMPGEFAVTVPDVTNGASLAPLAAYVERSRQQRAEVVAARSRVAAATANIDYQRRQSLRQVGASAGFKRVLGENSFLGGVTVQIPLFDRNQGEVQRATSDSLVAQKELALAERRATAEVQAAYAAAQKMTTQIAAIRTTVIARAADADRITLAAYQRGAATLLEVLDAGRALVESRLTYQRMVLAHRQSVLELMLAAGDEPFAPGRTPPNPPGTVPPIRTGDQR
jgi:cobalt-zinc-cadmium efflux system outer membrane protein